ncbi:MAG: glycosyltransferase family 2 protein [Deltaproteobacteria bacterium]|nr:glycosyltransferase family 2 protein [Deltaproteobacteria bacterium]
MLTLAVITLNEADRLARCLASAPGAGERLVVDSGSTDGTQAAAERAGARVITEPWRGHVAQKNAALSFATGDWILSLDADERLDAAAWEALAVALAAPGDAAGFSFTRTNRWLGRELRHGRWGRERKVRVVRRGGGVWVGGDPHDRLVVSGPVIHLQGAIIHEPYRSLAEHTATARRYAMISAETIRSQGRGATRLTAPTRAGLRFADAWLLRGGFLDGGPGLAVAGLAAWHTWLKWDAVRRLGARR